VIRGRQIAISLEAALIRVVGGLPEAVRGGATGSPAYRDALSETEFYRSGDTLAIPPLPSTVLIFWASASGVNGFAM